MDVAEERYLYGPPPTPFSPHNRHKVISFCTAITLRLPAFHISQHNVIAFPV